MTILPLAVMWCGVMAAIWVEYGARAWFWSLACSLFVLVASWTPPEEDS